MAWTIRNKLTGLGTVFGKLDGLKQSLQSRILRRAMNEAGQLVLNAARAEVPQQSGLYRKSLGKKIKTYKGSGTVVAIIGPRTGFKKEVTVAGPRGNYKTTRNPTRYAHLVEFGTKPHKLGKTATAGQHPGTPALKPLTKSWDSLKAEVQQVIEERIAREVARL